MPDESFYTLHDDFDADSTDGIRWRVCPILVRSIENWFSQIHYLEPIEQKYILDRDRVRQHFNRWCLQVEMLDPSRGKPNRSIASLLNPQLSSTESFCEYLLKMLQRYPHNPTIQRHWIAFFMHRCVAVGWRAWKSTPSSMQSFCLFQDIVRFGHCQLPTFNEVTPFLSNFTPGKSQLVSGLNHVIAYLDRQIKYSILPDLREILGEPNFGRSNLGIAARCSLSKIEAALENIQLSKADIEEHKILWQCFSIYKKETGIAVNNMGESDFETIKQNYQIRSAQAIDILNEIDVKTRLEQIGGIVRNYMLRQPIYFDAKINESQSLADIYPDSSQDLLKHQIDRARWEIIDIETTKICTDIHLSDKIPSHKQLLWLYYGLELRQNQIGKILQANFNLNPNPGSVSLRLSNSRRCLFDRIHTALENPSPALTEKEINTAMGELLERHFDSIISDYIFTSAAKLGISDRLRVSVAEQDRLIELLGNWLQQQIDLHIPAELFKSIVLQTFNRFSINQS